MKGLRDNDGGANPGSGGRRLALGWVRAGLFLASILPSLIGSPAAAQPFALGGSTVCGGGGQSAGGAYALAGTIGQPAVGAMSGGVWSLSAGFWNGIAAIQTAGGPTLLISRTATNTVTLRWPSLPAGWTLQQNTGIFGSTTWSDVQDGIQDDGTNRTFNASMSAGPMYFRLKQ